MKTFLKGILIILTCGLGAGIAIYWASGSQAHPSSLSTAGWTPAERITTTDGSSYYPHLFRDSQGNLHLVWLDWVDLNAHPPYILYAHKPAGGSWSDYSYLPDEQMGDFPVATMDTNDNLHIAWVSPSGKVNYIARQSDGVWSDIATVASEGTNPSIAVSTDGTVHMTWWYRAPGSAPNSQIYYAYKTPAGTWSSAQAIIDRADIGEKSIIRVDGLNTVHVLVDTDRMTAPIQPWYLYKKTGEDWSVAVQLPFNVVLWHNGQFAAAPDGSLHLAWFETSQSPVRTDLRYSTKPQDGNWSSPTRWRTDYANYTALDVDRFSKPHLAWIVGTDLGYRFLNLKGMWAQAAMSDMRTGWITSTSGVFNIEIDAEYNKFIAWDTGPVWVTSGQRKDERGDIFLTQLAGYPPVSTVITDTGGSLFSADGNTHLTFPAGSVTTDTLVTHSPANSPPAGHYHALNIFDLSANQVESGANVTSFPVSFTLQVTYTMEQLFSGIQDTLDIYWWDGAGWQTTHATHDMNARTLWVSLDHMTYFALLGETHRLYLPMLKR